MIVVQKVMQVLNRELTKIYGVKVFREIIFINNTEKTYIKKNCAGWIIERSGAICMQELQQSLVKAALLEGRDLCIGFKTG